MWAWIGVALNVSFSHSMSAEPAADLAKLVTFFAIGAGAISCALAGRIADRIGKAELTIVAMALSGCSALATAATFGGPIWISILCVMIWGITIIPDSAQFSALVADFAVPETAGSLLSLQTALGFALTAITVQVTPVLAERLGWPTVLALLALGPLFGIRAMWSLRRGKPTADGAEV
jgi:predicted MFS family arabinose efflux permease